MGVVCTRWASLSETAIFISAMTCFSPLASIVTYAASGVVCKFDIHPNASIRQKIALYSVFLDLRFPSWMAMD